MHIVDTASAVWLSLEVGVWCTVIGAPIALVFGYILSRHDFPAKSLIGTLLLAPLVVPPVVTGLVLLRLFGPNHAIGRAFTQFGVPVPFTQAAVVIAALTVSLPLYVVATRTAFDAVDRRYEAIAQSLGRTPRWTFVHVTLPLALPGIAAGALLAFARALGEFGATIVLAGNIEGRTQTIPLAIYSLLESPQGDEAMGPLLIASVAMAFASLLGVEVLTRWQRRRLDTYRDG
jgi:molybdate transport system permease protein